MAFFWVVETTWISFSYAQVSLSAVRIISERFYWREITRLIYIWVIELAIIGTDA